MEKLINFVKVSLILLIMAFGIAIRTHLYLLGASFFGDEGGLILNLMQKNAFQLLFPLVSDQQAPPVFLLLSKLIYHIWGINELALRFIPYVSSVLSVILFYFLCDKVFKNYFSKIIGILFFVSSHSLIYYSQIFKQYSLELLLSVVLLLIFFNLNLKDFAKREKFFPFLALSVFIPWCSYGAVFFIASFSLIFILYNLYSKNKEGLKYSFLYAVLSFFNILVYYFINLKGPATSENLRAVWQNFNGFFPNTQPEIFGLIEYVFKFDNTKLLWIIPLLLCLGAFALYKRNKFALLVLLLPILVTLGASAAHIYPFSERLVIFLFPNFILLFVASCEFISAKKWYISIPIILMFVIYYKFSTISGNLDYIKSGGDYDQTYIKEYVQELEKENIPEGAIIYAMDTEDGIIDCYKNAINKSGEVEFFRETEDKPIESMDRLPSNRIEYFHIYTALMCDEEEYKLRLNWIEKNCIIQKLVKEKHGYFVKCYKK